MVINYTFFYVEANIVCIVIFMIMVLRELSTVGRQAKQMFFVNTGISHILYFLCDIAWVQMLADIIPRTRFSISAVNICNALFLCFITGFWFIYVELSQGEVYIQRTRNRMFCLIPVLAETLVMVVLFVFFPNAVITGQKELTMLYYIVFLSMPVLYIVFSFFRTLIRALKKENYVFRKQFLMNGIYPVIVAIVGVVQTLWFSAPIFCFGSTIMLLYVYVDSLHDQVSIDELTRLNNRSQLRKHIASETSKTGGEKANRYVLMIDLNKFKFINDQYGHVEGDHALKRTADALRAACAESELKTFVGRYGGDEFIIVTKTENEDQIKALCSSIKETVVRMNKEAGTEYELTCSIGYSAYKGDIFAFQNALAKADEALYEDKKARASLR